jgi:hypothetical protein
MLYLLPARRRLQMRLNLTLLLLFFAFAYGTSHAERCVGYFDPPPRHCTGAGGCDTDVPTTSCTIGCTSGLCSNNANVADCCGVPAAYAGITSDGGDCTGQNCGLARIQLARQMRQRFENTYVRSTPLPPPMRLPLRRVFMLNTCTQDYVIAYEWDGTPTQKQGM